MSCSPHLLILRKFSSKLLAEHKCKPENYVDDDEDEDEDAEFLQFTTSSSQTAKLDAFMSCPCTIGRVCVFSL